MKSVLIQWYSLGDRCFRISAFTKFGKSMMIARYYVIIVYEESFSRIHCTILGIRSKGRPILRESISFEANVTIIGSVRIGNNVTIGMGIGVLKDLSNDCATIGNLAKVIKMIYHKKNMR